MIYKVIHEPTGKSGIGKNTWDALQKAIGDKRYFAFMESMPRVGFKWSAYTTRSAGSGTIKGRKAPVQKKSLMYEVASVHSSSSPSEHLLTVYRSESPTAINSIEEDGLTKVATPAKQVAKDSKRPRTPAKRVVADKKRKVRRKL